MDLLVTIYGIFHELKYDKICENGFYVLINLLTRFIITKNHKKIKPIV